MHPRRKRPRYLLPPIPSSTPTMPPSLINSSSPNPTPSASTAVTTAHLPPRANPPTSNKPSSSTPASSTASSSSAPGQTQACAACKFQRRKCEPNCILAPYFPHDHTRQFQNAHKLFGVSNITKIIKHLGPLEKDEAMRTIMYQSDARAHDPVGGCFGIVRDLQRQIDLCQAELDFVLRQLEFFRQQEAAAALGCDLLNGHNTVTTAVAATSTDPFIQAFGMMPSDEPSHHNINNAGLGDDFNLNHNNVVNSNGVVAWAMHECSTPTSNGDNGVTVMMPHHPGQHQHLFHQPGDEVDDHNNDRNSKQHVGFNIAEQCDDIKPLILDLPHDDDHRQQHHDFGFSSEEAIDGNSNPSVLESNEEHNNQRQGVIDFHHDHNDLKDAATFFTLTNCSS